MKDSKYYFMMSKAAARDKSKTYCPRCGDVLRDGGVYHQCPAAITNMQSIKTVDSLLNMSVGYRLVRGYNLLNRAEL